ncbi:cell division protein FtsQ/DivIB [Polaribacter sp. L3A8]|uniref:cell division protein FtsQ/DivIB n=1 Tax=Polaribacter sp. L3A8 TaxID=2686361 RepID=UPI00131D32B7|nr:cell division protein FtsQ/DivIB [Polaribacter sp. L3A8]
MMIKKFLKYIAFLLLIVVLGLLYSFSSTRNSNKKVKDIVVEFEAGENNFLTHAMVNKLLIQNDSTVKNQAKSVINLYSLEKMVSKNPYVEHAAVFLTIAGTLKTIIKQRTPVVRIMNKNDSYYVDKQGVKIPLSPNYSARVMLVSGVKKEEEIKELLPLISFILQDNFLQKEVVGIEKFNDGEYQFTVRSGSYKIDFGQLTEMDVKFKKLKAFYNKAFEDKTIEDYKTINLKYHNQVVCAK